MDNRLNYTEENEEHESTEIELSYTDLSST